MDQKVIDSWKHLSDLLDQIWPYKRVGAPLDLIEKYNNTVGKENGVLMKQFAITIDKNVEPTDDMIWEAMTMKVGVESTVFGGSKINHKPPTTNRPPCKLDEL